MMPFMASKGGASAACDDCCYYDACVCMLNLQPDSDVGFGECFRAMLASPVVSASKVLWDILAVSMSMLIDDAACHRASSGVGADFSYLHLRCVLFGAYLSLFSTSPSYYRCNNYRCACAMALGDCVFSFLSGGYTLVPDASQCMRAPSLVTFLSLAPLVRNRWLGCLRTLCLFRG